MSGAKFKAPPPWEDGKAFEKWDEVKLWQLVTDLQKTQLAPALALSLECRNREVALQLTPTQLSGENGVTTLLDHLKTVFAKNETGQVFEAHLQFEKISRGDLTMNDYN